MRVHFAVEFDDNEMGLLRPHLDEAVELTSGTLEDEAARGDMARAEVLVAGHVTEELLDAASSARAVIVPYAGPPAATMEAVGKRPGLTLHNLHHNAQATAEMALALLFAASKHLVPRHKEFEEHGWPARLWNDSDTVLLESRTALVAGYGSIGRRIARVLVALGMEVHGLRRSCEEPYVDDLGVHVFGMGELHERLARTNALVVALPGTPHTEGLFGAKELGLLQAPSVVVNVGRGPVIDQEALYEGLRDGRITCAGLDVWWTYPSGALDDATGERGSPFPFHELPNIAMSPHRGGLSDLDAAMRMEDLGRLLNAAARGEEIPNEVDTSSGY